MEIDVIKYFLTQGPFAVLFVWLLVYVMRKNNEREGRLYDQIDKQTSLLLSLSEKYEDIAFELRELNRFIKK